MKKLEVSAIEEGTVIDQIANKSTFKVANILNTQKIEQAVLIGFNLSSKKLGKKRYHKDWWQTPYTGGGK